MKAELEIGSDSADELARSIGPSLTTDERVSHSVESDGATVEVTVETDALGTLRGATDTALKLAMVSEKIIER